MLIWPRPANRTSTAMIADLLFDTNTVDAAGSALSEYALCHPLQIAICLRKLAARHHFMSVEFGGRQMMTQLLDIDSSNARFVFDFGSLATNKHVLLEAPELIFRGLPDGVRTEFATRSAQLITFEGRLALEARFPDVLYHVQRREFFRVDSPVLQPYTASGKFSDGGAFSVDIKDLSLGGVALRSPDASFGEIEIGTRLEDVTLSVGAFGTLRVTMEVVSPRRTVMRNGKQRFVIGCRFIDFPAVSERTLQRVVTYLEAHCLGLASR
jgi:c-di-GMP-binding flagellar brake protein YcgR